MTALVTGASGFLGGALVRALVAKGERVRVLARAGSHLEHLADLRLEVHRGALEDAASLGPALANVTTVYHCAGVATDWAPRRDYVEANVTGVQHLLDASARAGTVTRFLHVSTTDVYGYPTVACDERHALVDVGLPYNSTKVAGEQRVWAFHQATGLPVTVVRPATIYGPRSVSCVGEICELLQTNDMVWIDKGRSGAGLLYIDNAVTAILAAASSEAAIGQAYNLRDEANTTWREFVEGLAREMNVALPTRSLPRSLAWALATASEGAYGLVGARRRPLLTRHAVHLFSADQNYSIEKARRELGFRSAVGLADGLRACVEWFMTGREHSGSPRLLETVGATER